MYGKINEHSVQKAIMDGFIDRFIKSEFCFFDDESKSRNLLWCFFREESTIVFPTEELAKIKLPSNDALYFYSERTEELYKTDFSDICEFVNSLEPWEEIDAEIFDETMNWVVAVTHEDFSMIIGIDDY